MRVGFTGHQEVRHEELFPRLFPSSGFEMIDAPRVVGGGEQFFVVRILDFNQLPKRYLDARRLTGKRLCCLLYTSPSPRDRG